MSREQLAVNTIKALTMDAVEAAGCGHPGMPMGMADVATVLWTKYLKHDPSQPDWPDRDRFVLSAGHGSMLLYSLMYLSGYEDMSLDELRRFRQWGARTAGHPEFGHAKGIETTTGPLGQGLANAVGMALGERLMAGRFNTDTQSLIDHRTWVIAGDGCLQEGVAHEAASLAGHLGLGKLTVFWDDNRITIDGSTDISFTEDVLKRFEALGWHTLSADGHNQTEVAAAIDAAMLERDRPTLIRCRTHIGHGAPNKQDTAKAHGAALGAEEVAATKRGMGWPESPAFHVPSEALEVMREHAAKGTQERIRWDSALEGTSAATQQRLRDELKLEVPGSAFAHLPQFETGTSIATRKASGAVLDSLAPHLPTLLGGSADLTGSNNTWFEGAEDVQANSTGSKARYVRYGVREHGMGAIMNGLSLHGGFRPYSGTFLVFSDYMRPAVRLSALMQQPVIYVFTHDSIFLGEDGPTHQPVEHAMSLRLIPNLHVMRPADANETAAAWRLALTRTSGPSALLLTRQGLPVLEATADHSGALRGGYILRKESGDLPQVILLATGSEVSLALAAADKLGSDTRVVSIPCWEEFLNQEPAYLEEVLPPQVTKRIAIEAGSTLGWQRLIGTGGLCIGLDGFGASAPISRLQQEFGFTTDQVVQKIQDYLS
jgi:transketolase